MMSWDRTCVAPRKQESRELVGNTARNGARDRVAGQAIEFNTDNTG